MSRVRLVASDLDGTLLDAEGALTERTARSWRALWDQGIETVLVTARPPRWVDALAGITGAHGVVLCLNGAFVYDAAHRRVRSHHAMDPATVAEVAGRLRGIPGICFSAELADGAHREPCYSGGLPAGVTSNEMVSVGPIEEVPGPVGKILARSDALGPREFLARVRTLLGDTALLSTSCEGGLAEIGPSGITKASALETWCEGLGIDAADVWAFGDMPNDIPMLDWSGTGWAVANAHPDVLAVADRVCAENTREGVAEAIETLLERPAAP
ncbi:haloacid dehalogenase [Brachybacterium endophyticum]|uniref:Haloacid dehalogenase n=1 Tax=Brachybacterium endophyticum TaxID=2182385 RepID=A0A2U2RNQ0_9MICO|nr:HAD family hydrolase [Brachybacterium endophyticum]PWH07493.1 haloacid dehalogenase [Brachybacterium endophyticum]